MRNENIRGKQRVDSNIFWKNFTFTKSTTLEIEYNENSVNRERVIEWVKKAGEEVGFCDWRPKYGRFEVEIL